MAETMSLINTLAGSAPGTLAAIIVIVLFLKYLRERDAKRDASNKALVEQIQETNRQQTESCHQVQRDSVEAIKENTKAIQDLRVTLAERLPRGEAA